MATVSFGRPVMVNTDWGIKNLEYAADHPINLKEIVKDAEPLQMATEEDMQKFVENNLK